jgi:signal transduction histidine kinase
MPRARLRIPSHPFAWLLSKFREFHEQEPWRLQYACWFGAVSYVLMYFVRFMRPHYDPTDDVFIRIPTILLLVIAGLRDRWRPALMRYYFVFAWWTLAFSIAFGVSFISFERAMVEGYGPATVSNFFILMTLLVLITEWRNVIVMLIVGVGVAAGIARSLHPDAHFPSEIARQLPAFAVILAGSAIVQRRVLSRLAETEARIQALRDSVGFLAHELNTPMATVRGYLSVVRSSYLDSAQGVAQFSERREGDLVTALENAEQRALYCQSLLSAFAQSARRLSPGAESQRVKAEELLRAILREYPFARGQRNWVSLNVKEDFDLPGRDLLYLVITTVIQNALEALRAVPRPDLQIKIGRCSSRHASRSITFTDNGPGIPPQVLVLLTHKPVTGKGDDHGMGLVFASRVMLALGGSIQIQSEVGSGTKVSLFFDIRPEALESGFHDEAEVPAAALT